MLSNVARVIGTNDIKIQYNIIITTTPSPNEYYNILPILSPFAPSAGKCTSLVVVMSQQFTTSSIDMAGSRHFPFPQLQIRTVPSLLMFKVKSL